MLNGTDVLLLIEDPGTPGTWIPIPAQMDATIEESRGVIEYSSKDEDAQRVGYGRYSSSVSLDLVVKPNDQVQAAVRSAIRNATPTEIRKQVSEVEIEKATLVIESLSESDPDQDKSQWSISGQIDGTWTAV